MDEKQKAMQREKKRQWREQNRDRYNATRREWRKKNRARIAAVKNAERARWRERNPEKERAHRVIENAIRAGRMTPPDQCRLCGERGRIEAHHFDYSKPEEVTWLCSTCHREAHLRIRGKESA